MKKILLRILAGLAILVVLIIGFVLISWDKEFEAPYPDHKASKDSAVIARGKYLAYGPAHCAVCHVPVEKVKDVEIGMEIPLSGGGLFIIPPGRITTPNLTPDMETGIGKLSDGEIARAMRYSVRHDNRIMMPYMPFQDLSDEDVVAVLSFLRSQEPVKNKVEKTRFTFLGKALLAFGALKPVGPRGTPPQSVVRDSTAAYGEYIARSIANCVGCHTARDMKSGAFIGPDFAGGFKFPPEPLTNGFSFISPNITPDKETGIMTAWNESFFINRFHQGRIIAGSPMPWGPFSRIDDVDLKALYGYIKSLDPVYNKIEKTIFAPGESLPRN